MKILVTSLTLLYNSLSFSYMFVYTFRASGNQENNPLGLHQVMFIPTIEKQGTKEQIQKYVVPAKQMKILGTYAQTELGHG